MPVLRATYTQEEEMRMQTHAPPTPLEADRWYRSTFSFDAGVPIRDGDDAVLDRPIDIRYLIRKITEKKQWFEYLGWIQSFAPDEVMKIEPLDVRPGIVLVAYAVTNHETLTLDKCAYLFEAMRILPHERHFPKTQSCAIMVGLSIFEGMEAALGYPPIDE